MNNTHEGKRIKAITWPDSESEQGRCIRETLTCHIYIEKSFCGDHEDWWAVEHNKKGQETARHNLRYVESIIWSEPIPTN